jgi:hypothetical protein
MSNTDKLSDYLANRMSAAETAEFELELLEDKGLQAELEQHMMLKRSLQSIESEAAPEMPATFMLAQPPVVYVETMRGAEAALQLDTTPVLLAVDVGPNSPQSFRVEIRTADANASSPEVLTEETFADEEGYVNVMVPQLDPGEYQCQVRSAEFSKTIQLST